MSYTCLLMVLCECACAKHISKANFNLINRTDLFIFLHIMFQISFQNSKGQKSYRKFLGVRSELLLSIQHNFVLNMLSTNQFFKENVHPFDDVFDDVTKRYDICHR